MHRDDNHVSSIRQTRAPEKAAGAQPEPEPRLLPGAGRKSTLEFFHVFFSPPYCFHIQSSFGTCCILPSAPCSCVLTQAAQLCKKGEFVPISAWIKAPSGRRAHVPLTSITYAADALARVSGWFSTPVAVTSVMERRGDTGLVSSGFRRTRPEKLRCSGSALCGPPCSPRTLNAASFSSFASLTAPSFLQAAQGTIRSGGAGAFIPPLPYQLIIIA